jgi:hypothetical protein
MYRWERLAPPQVIKDALFELEAAELVKRTAWPGGPSAGIEASRALSKNPAASSVRLERRNFQR